MLLLSGHRRRNDHRKLRALAPSSVNLTEAGLCTGFIGDWSAPRLFGAQKCQLNTLISEYTKLGTGFGSTATTDNLVSYNWSDGQPTVSTAGTTTGIFVNDAIWKRFRNYCSREHKPQDPEDLSGPLVGARPVGGKLHRWQCPPCTSTLRLARFRAEATVSITIQFKYTTPNG